MSKIIKVNNGFVKLDEFTPFLGHKIADVKYYSVKANKDKTVKVTFYDLKKKIVKPVKE